MAGKADYPVEENLKRTGVAKSTREKKSAAGELS